MPVLLDALSGVVGLEPAQADAHVTNLQVVHHIAVRHALDGSDPNSLSGVFWTLGRYDRAWGPERPIFGKVRYMSSDNTARKFRVKGYVREYAPSAGLFG